MDQTNRDLANIEQLILLVEHGVVGERFKMSGLIDQMTSKSALYTSRNRFDDDGNAVDDCDSTVYFVLRMMSMIIRITISRAMSVLRWFLTFALTFTLHPKIFTGF